MNINWKVRIRNKAFWLAIIPALLLLVQAVATLFGLTIDLADTQGKLIAVVDAAFVVLAVLGIVNDPTTASFEDSALAMTYEEPKRAEHLRREGVK